MTEEKQKDEESRPVPPNPPAPPPAPPLPAWHPAAIIATGAGAGFLPLAPGTWASALCLPPAWLIASLAGREALAMAALLAVILGIWASDLLERREGVTDPGYIVIDEIAGQWIAVLAVAPDPLLYAIAFVLFRLADIFKPWPVSWAEKLPGGFGVMFDDVLAGAYAAAGVYLCSLWI
ncbi:MAG: phosphatidylglycerophosphatase A [Rhodospirillales bacterium]